MCKQLAATPTRLLRISLNRCRSSVAASNALSGRATCSAGFGLFLASDWWIEPSLGVTVCTVTAGAMGFCRRCRLLTSSSFWVRNAGT